MKNALLAALVFAAGPLTAAPGKVPHKTWTDPEAALREDPDFAIQGEYGGTEAGVGVQVIALGEGKFEAKVLTGGLPGHGWSPEKPRHSLSGKREGGNVVLTGGDMSATLSSGESLALVRPGQDELIIPRNLRQSPTLGAKPPKDAIVLFDGSSTDAWQNGRMENGLLLSTGATSKQLFGDYTLHLEFRTPYMPGARGQGRGNSGVYHSGRWETQVLDSFGLEGRDNECGGIYSISKPRLNMCLPPLAWQTYDVKFTAAKFDENGKRTAWSRITVKLNGVLVHEDLELPKDFTTAAPINSPLASPEGPVFIQNHNDPVVFRNIWIVPGK
ncbi:MAG: 3-keto-disaccharide hydrolase [Luteolibacter sp.]